jgi:hypothetical protein
MAAPWVITVKLTADGRRIICSVASVCSLRKAYESRDVTIANPPK